MNNIQYFGRYRALSRFVFSLIAIWTMPVLIVSMASMLLIMLNQSLLVAVVVVPYLYGSLTLTARLIAVTNQHLSMSISDFDKNLIEGWSNVTLKWLTMGMLIGFWVVYCWQVHISHMFRKAWKGQEPNIF